MEEKQSTDPGLVAIDESQAQLKAFWAKHKKKSIAFLLIWAGLGGLLLWFYCTQLVNPALTDSLIWAYRVFFVIVLTIVVLSLATALEWYKEW